jgi:hypothetical protein
MLLCVRSNPLAWGTHVEWIEALSAQNLFSEYRGATDQVFEPQVFQHECHSASWVGVCCRQKKRYQVLFHLEARVTVDDRVDLITGQYVEAQAGNIASGTRSHHARFFAMDLPDADVQMQRNGFACQRGAPVGPAMAACQFRR